MSRTITVQELPKYYSQIKANFDSNDIWTRGSSYVSKVKNPHFIEDDIYFAKIEGSPQYGGSSHYKTKVTLNNRGNYEAECSCPYNRDGKGDYCKHISALVRYMHNNNIEFKGDSANQNPNTTDQNLQSSQNPQTFAQPLESLEFSKLKRILTSTKNSTDNQYSLYYIKFNIHHSYGGQLSFNLLKVNKKTKKYTTLDLESTFKRYENGACDYMTQDEYEFIKKTMQSKSSGYYSSSFIDSNVSEFRVEQVMDEYYSLGKFTIFEKNFEYYPDTKIIPQVYINSKKEFRVRGAYEINNNSEIQIIPVTQTSLILIGRQGNYFAMDRNNHRIYKLKNKESPEDIQFIIKSSFLISEQNALDLAVEIDEQKIILPEKIAPKALELQSLIPQIYLSENQGLLNFEVGFNYSHNLASKVIMANSEANKFEIEVDGNKILAKRNTKLEQKNLQFLQEVVNDNFASDFKLGFGNNINGEEAILFVTEVVDSLVETNWQIFGQDKLKVYNFVKPKVNFGLSSGTDWLSLNVEMSVNNQDIDMETIAKMVRKNKRFIDLKNGQKVVLPSIWLDKHKELFELGEVSGGELKVSKWHLSLLQEFSKVANDGKNQKTWTTQIQNIFSLDSIVELPAPNLKATLRPYQQAGYEWLNYMYSNTLGGILADDMGLGKTLQAIALLNQIYNTNQSSNQILEKDIKSSKPKKIAKKNTTTNLEQSTIAPTLIILPKTLIINWQMELTKFAPNLTFEVMHGASRDKDKWSAIGSNIVLTTYHTAMKDVLEIKKQNWNLLILDESQNIKNPEGLIYKALRTIPAVHKLALSGTPVENSLEDLWSQMSLLNPGILGSREWFRSNFLLPIQKNKDEEQSTKLKNIVYPFILRRLKRDVTKELGEKVENTLYIEMDTKQKNLYDGVRLEFKRQIEEEFDNSAFKAKFKVLEGLTKLRQICCDPRLLDPKTHIESAKLELMLEQLEDVIKEGHKVLVFSQFTTMLALIKSELDKRGIIFSYLDGKTNNRQKAVDEFNDNPNIPVFLISIKAGGVGLNLTSADYVFIFDPWWNPAVESQAVDRSHRIGQTKTVFVYRFLVKNSVEEKILELQQTKKNLVKNIITVDESLMKNLNKNDIAKLFG